MGFWRGMWSRRGWGHAGGDHAPVRLCWARRGKDTEVPGDRDPTDQWQSQDLKAEVALGIRPAGLGQTGWADRRARRGRRTAPSGNPGASLSRWSGWGGIPCVFLPFPTPAIPSGVRSDMDKAGTGLVLWQRVPLRKGQAHLCALHQTCGLRVPSWLP